MDKVIMSTKPAKERKLPQNVGCWAKFKSMFEERGFDLEYEYNSTASGWTDTNSDAEGYKRIEDRKISVLQKRKSIPKQVQTLELDGQLSDMNFYDQFASIDDKDTKDDDSWRRPSNMRNRISVRPSIYLANIVEESSEFGDDELEEVSTYIFCITFIFSDKLKLIKYNTLFVNVYKQIRTPILTFNHYEYS